MDTTRARPRHARSAVIGALMGAVVACGLAAGAIGPDPAAAVPAASPTAAAKLLHPAPGLVFWRQRFTVGKDRPERAVLMRVNLHQGSGLRVDAAIPRQGIGAPRRTVAAEADATGAIAGVNADWFDLTTSVAVPRGAVIRSGRVLKTPRHGWRANLFQRADGTLGIGAIAFHGSVKVPTSSAHASRAVARARVFSVNASYDAQHGHIVFVTPALLGFRAYRGCTVAYGRGTGAHQVITQVDTGVTSVPRLHPQRWALLACGGTGGQWLRATLHAGTPVDVSLQFPDGKPVMALSGGRVLVHNGAPFIDAGGQRLWGANPMTFACVSQNGRSLLLGVVDGRTTASFGVTQPQLSQYLLGLHCWDGMTFDGGGSTTMASRLPGGDTYVSVLNVPSDGRPRAVADGLYVYRTAG